MEMPVPLHKTNYFIHKDCKSIYIMLKYVLRAVHCLFMGRLWSHSQHISMSETQGGGLKLMKNYLQVL